MNANTKIELLSESRKAWIKKHPFITGFLVLIIIIVFVDLAKDSSVSTTPQTSTPVAKEQSAPQKQEAPAISKEQAQKDLDELMSKSKKAGLVTSYDFSKLDESTYRWDIFIGSPWYGMTVQQKKDFVAYIALRKKAITGFSHFEIRDGYSNEKVGALTAFSQSIEVYK